jgi:hypothetical protein
MVQLELMMASLDMAAQAHFSQVSAPPERSAETNRLN